MPNLTKITKGNTNLGKPNLGQLRYALHHEIYNLYKKLSILESFIGKVAGCTYTSFLKTGVTSIEIPNTWSI